MLARVASIPRRHDLSTLGGSTGVVRPQWKLGTPPGLTTGRYLAWCIVGAGAFGAWSTGSRLRTRPGSCLHHGLLGWWLH